MAIGIQQFQTFLYKIKRLFAMLFITHYLLACSQIQTMQNDSLNKDEGLAFFSMTQSGYPDSLYKLTFINELTKREFTAELSNDDIEIGSRDDEKNGFRSFVQPKGKLVVLSLPEGIYRLKEWLGDAKKEPGQYSLSHALNKRFKVLNGRVLYLGNIHLHTLKNTQSVFIRDSRIRDLSFFYKKYPQIDSKKLLISSKVFLNPALNKDPVFKAYTDCRIKGYELFSNTRLPTQIEKFRTLRIGSEQKKISRIDGYRLKYKSSNDAEALNIKVELSDARQYVEDKMVIREWFDNFKQKTKYRVAFEKKSGFSEFQLKTSPMLESRMLYMVVMLNDDTQMITTMTFFDPPEKKRSDKALDDFMPRANSVVNSYKKCIINNLNHI